MGVGRGKKSGEGGNWNERGGGPEKQKDPLGEERAGKGWLAWSPLE
jgi:hypothetical protein